MAELKEGYVLDYISGLSVKETPEEIEAVQPFSKILVDDYGYPKEHIHTRPQYRVKVRPFYILFKFANSVKVPKAQIRKNGEKQNII